MLLSANSSSKNRRLRLADVSGVVGGWWLVVQFIKVPLGIVGKFGKTGKRKSQIYE